MPLRPSPSYLSRIFVLPVSRRSFSSSRTMATEFKLKGVTSLALPANAKQEAEVEGIENGKVLLVNAGGKVQAIGAKCTHYGAPLAKGVLSSDGRIRCPWHGACFSAKTGDVEEAPGLDSLPVFKVTERNGEVYVTGDEAAIKGSKRQPNITCQAGAAQSDKVVIVGGGSAAIGAIEGLREYGYTGGITVVSSEGNLPIDRPKLSKALLADLSKLQLRNKAWFEGGSVDWVDGQVTGVDFSSRIVTTQSGQTYDYTKLILATGGRARTLPVQGFPVLENIFTLRSVSDVRAIVEAIGEKGKKIVIVGASFIGMEVANATCKDNDVTVIDMTKTPLERVLGDKIGAGIQKAIEGKGVKFHMGAGIEKAEPSTSEPAKVGAVVLKDGTSIAADLVILGVGVSPATEFLKDNAVVRLENDGSLSTDENFQVSGLKDVYAVGDIATFPYHGPGGEGKPVRIEHWNVAQNAGRHAASHIAKASQKRTFGIPIFWSALGAQMRYCGNIANGWDDLVLQGEPADLKFVAYYTKGDTVVAMASMGMDPVMVQSSELMRIGKMPGKQDLQKGVDIMTVGI